MSFEKFLIPHTDIKPGKACIFYSLKRAMETYGNFQATVTQKHATEADMSNPSSLLAGIW